MLRNIRLPVCPVVFLAALPWPPQACLCLPHGCSSGQRLDGLTNGGPRARRQGFVSLGWLTAGNRGSFNMQALACPRPPSQPSWRQLPAVPARRYGLGGGELLWDPLSVPWASPSPARQVPLGTPHPRMPGQGAQRPEGLHVAFVSPALLARPAPARRLRPRGLSVKSCRQSRLTSSSERTGRTEAQGRLTRN